jgi:enoyl-CoA hydratase
LQVLLRGADMSEPTFRLEQRDNLLEVVLDRPPVNALSSASYAEIKEVFDGAGVRGDVDVLLLRSANPKIFSAGADIREVASMVAGDDEAADVRRQRLAREAWSSVVNCAIPSVAAVNGPALGAGAVLASCCDIRLASAAAKVGLPEINVARCGGGRHLMRLAPQGIVRQMFFTGRPLDAQQALRAGLVNEVMADGDALLYAARALAAEIATKSPYALRLAKESLNRSESLPLEEGYRVEQEYTLMLGRSQHAVEASAAFLEKREPIWPR